jgi:DNA recombination protein RmuC
MESLILPIMMVLSLTTLVLVVVFRPKSNQNSDFSNKLSDLMNSLFRLEQGLKEEFRLNREDALKISKENRLELNTSMKDQKKEISETLKIILEQNGNNLKEIHKTLDEKLMLLASNSKDQNAQLRAELEKSLKAVQENFDKNVESFNKLQKDKFEVLEKKQTELINATEKRLEEMRITVEEKLQETLNKRLGQSFETVGKQLQAVQEGLGEMKNLANDVGGLKKVLGNVKMRGGIGEMQLSMLLEQILAPDQYAANIKTKQGSGDLVEFAIKLPGKEDGLDQVWLPIDAKFPKDYYEQLQAAHDLGDLIQIEMAQKNLENAVKKMAKDISDKYIDPPNTTDFAIMFLPFEGIYAEVVRKSSLLDELQRNYKIIVTGPTTLAAILNSLQMGFKTLAIQKRSSEVWKVLGAVKTEFEKFGVLLEKSQKHFQAGIDDLDNLVGTRTRMIKSKLKSIEALSEGDAKLILPLALTNEHETTEE